MEKIFTQFSNVKSFFSIYQISSTGVYNGYSKLSAYKFLEWQTNHVLRYLTKARLEDDVVANFQFQRQGCYW